MFGGGRQLARHQGVGVDNDHDLDKPVAKYPTNETTRIHGYNNNNKNKNKRRDPRLLLLLLLVRQL